MFVQIWAVSAAFYSKKLSFNNFNSFITVLYGVRWVDVIHVLLICKNQFKKYQNILRESFDLNFFNKFKNNIHDIPIT